MLFTAASRMEENIAVDSRGVLSVSDMNYELRRLETFRFWPSDAAVDPQRIAKAGFYSTGIDLEVKCFSCGKCISEWEYGDQVMAKHRAISPDCAFVRNPLECENVPVLPPIGSQADYRKEAERLASFRGWPSPHVTPRSLARNGLYYLREGDMVACAFCSVMLHAWQAGDDPLAEHRRESPNCPLLFGYNVGNVPLDHTGSGIIEGQEVPEEVSSSNSSQDSPGVEEYVEIRPFAAYESSMSNKELASNPQFGAQAHKPPIHTRYQTKEARLASFSDWPSVTPMPEALADAGFFYQGMMDHACCFHCNGGLHNWDPADDPWEEHARWFSRCPFVGIIKGREFIQRAIAKKPPMLPISQLLQQEGITTQTNGEVPQIAIEPSHSPDVNGHAVEQMGEDVTSFMPSPPYHVPLTTQEEVVASTTIESSTVSDNIAASLPRQVSNSDITQVLEKLQDLAVTDEKGAAATMSKTTSDSKPSLPDDLAEENRRLTEARLCKVCLDEDVGVVFLPCGHLITCVKCAPNLAHCPMCRERIQATVRTYFS